MVYPALLPLIRIPRLPAVDWTDAPADLNGLVRFAERRNLVSACAITFHLASTSHCVTSETSNASFTALSVLATSYNETAYFHSHSHLLTERYRFADGIFVLCKLKTKYFVDQMRVWMTTSVWGVRWWGIAPTTWMTSLLLPSSPKTKYDGFTEHSSRSAPVEPSMN